MTAKLAVLRPEPGNAATAARIEALGFTAIRLPLFVVVPVAWEVPDLADIDALLVTSANAIRHGGEGLAALRHLPVIAVGAATAGAAIDAGFTVHAEGAGGIEAALILAKGSRLLHLAGRDRATNTGLPTIIVYASDPVAVDPSVLLDTVCLVHSRRAGRRLAEIAGDKSRIAVAAIGAAALVGDGWRSVAVADAPTDAALIVAARSLAD